MPRIYTHIDYTGRRFGRLLVIQEIGRKIVGRKNPFSYVLWLCRCDCGNETKVPSSSIKHVRSCGCLKRERQLQAITKTPRVVASTLQHNIYKRNASERGYTWSLTKEDVESIIFLPCAYCGALPANKLFNSKRTFVALVSGIDRIDSGKGYEKDNVAPCCWICNKAKGSSTHEEFMTWIRRLTEFQSQRKKL